jgi:hypothetical protein
MVTFKGTLKDAIFTLKSGVILSIESADKYLTEDVLNGLKDSKNGLKIDISKWREARSRDANAYCWVLLDKIAEATNSTKELIYREIIKRVGVFEVLPIKDVAVESFIKKWQSKGLGWVCEILGQSKLKDYTNIVAYFGTSTYDTKEMSRFIDEVVQEAKGLGIQTETPDKIAEMKSLWGAYEK